MQNDSGEQMMKAKQAHNLDISKPWDFEESQFIEVFGKKYNVHEAIRLSKNIKVKPLKVDDLFISYSGFGISTLREFVEHSKAVEESDLSFPVLMNEDGYIIDGRHRLAKAILTGEKTIKCKRFVSDPSACFEWV